MPQARQSTDAVLMIRPCRFFPNPETAVDNTFQQELAEYDPEKLTAAARDEFDVAVTTLRENGVTVHVIEDSLTPEKPDAVFPNNWISTHHDGRVVLYPMFSRARRQERRLDVIDELRRHYAVNEVVDYSKSETDKQYLEGTGSLVLDHAHRIAYVSLSQRAHPEPLKKFCADFNFEPVIFRSHDASGCAIYHTNVMMCLGTSFAIIGLHTIRDSAERKRVGERLEASGKESVELLPEQIANFAGNAIELHNATEQLLILSTRAHAALSEKQIHQLERHARIIPLHLPTIELAGGSARCMMATIHLPRLPSARSITRTAAALSGRVCCQQKTSRPSKLRR
jgi:hypothetical protein